MVAVRTLVVTVSPLLTELVTATLQPHLSLDIVEVVRTREQLTEKLRDVAPDLVILGLINAETDDCAKRMLAAAPLAQVLVLAADGQRAWLYEMRPRRTTVTDLSAFALLRVLKTRLDGTRKA
jgi:chemotaxis response regulator CheB